MCPSTRPGRPRAAAGILASSGVKAAVVAAELAPALRAAWAGARPPAPPDPGRQSRGASADCPGSGSAGPPGVPSSDACWAEVIADDAPSPLAAAARERRPGVHPLHLGLDRPAQRRDALARQCVHLPGLVLTRRSGPGTTTTDSPRTHRSTSIFRSSTSSPRAATRATLVLIGETLGKDPAALGDFISPSGGSASGTRRRRSCRSWPSTGGWTGRTSARRGWCSSPARSFRSPRSDGCERSGRRPRCGTSTGRPRPTSARPFRSPRRSRRIAPSHTRSARSARRSALGSSTSMAATCRRVSLGELVIAGPGVMRGYFGQPELTAAAFLVDGDDSLVSHRRPGARRRHRLLPVPRPSRPDGQEARLPDRAGRDRVGPLSPRRRRPRRGRGPVRRSRRLDRGVRRAQARPEEVDHRHEAALHELSAPLHDPRHDHVSGRPARDLDRQGRLSASEILAALEGLRP